MANTRNEVQRIRDEYARRAQDVVHRALYSLFNPGTLFLYTQLMRHILATLRRHGMRSLHGQRILEVGCGEGSVLRAFLTYGAEVQHLHGIDLIEPHVQHALSVNPYLPLTCANGQALPYQDSAFDMVLQFTVFSSVLDPELKTNIAHEMLRVLKPGGFILWYDFWLNPTNPQTHGVRPREIKELFPDCRFEFHRITLAPPIARRLAKWSWGACLLLERLWLFNTHYLVIIRPGVKY